MQFRATTIGIGLLTAGMGAIGAAYVAAVAGATAPWVPFALIAGAASTSVSLFVLGAATRRVRSGAVNVSLAALGLLLVAAFGAAGFLAPDAPAAPLVLGLPRRLAIVFYGIGLVPTVGLPLLFGLTFGRPARDEGSS